MPEGTRLAQKEDKRGTARRLAGFLLSGDEFLGALTGGRSQQVTSRLPGPARFAVDTLLSPIGLASAIFAPFTGGGSLALKTAAQVGVKAVGKEVGKRAVGELAVSALGQKAGEAASSMVPEDAPGVVQIGVPLAAGVLAGAGAMSALNAGKTTALRTQKAMYVQELSARAQASGTTHMAPLPEFGEVMAGVKTIPDDGAINRIKRAVIGTTGINPSILEETDVGIAHIAYQRVMEQVDDHVALTLAKALPKGLDSFTIDKATGAVRGSGGVHWNDLLSEPDAIKKYALTPAQAQDYTAVHQILDDVRTLYRQADLPHIDDAFMENGKLYVPRQAKESGGFAFDRPSKASLQRVWEDANDAAARGVVYDNPTDTLYLHISSAYKALARKQFSDAIEDMALAPKAAMLKSERGKALYAEYVGALKAQRAVEADMRLNQRQIKNLDARRSEARAAGRTRREENLEAAIDAKRVELEAAVKDRAAALDVTVKARNQYRAMLKRTENAEALPASFFGRGGEGIGERDLIEVGKWKGKFLPKDDDYKRLMGWFNEQGVPVHEAMGLPTQIATRAGDLLRFSTATFDVAMPFVQGLPLLAADPVAWGRMAVKHYQAFFKSDVQTGYLKANFDSINDMVTNGRVPIGDIERFNAIREGGPIMRRLRSAPGVTNFVAAYDMGLTVARHELWAALRPAWKGTPEELGQYVRNMTGGLELRGLGVGPGQRGVEGMILFAPRLFRSTAALVLDAARFWTPEGAQALRTLSRMATGATMVMMLANMWQGLNNGESYEEIIDKRLSATMNPLEGKKFLSMQAENGEWYGVGGQVRSIAQFVARMASDPVAALKADPRDNPLLAYAQGRLSPAASIGLGVAEYATGENLNILPYEYLDNPIALLNFIDTSALPFAVQAMIEGQQITPVVTDLLHGEFDSSASPQATMAGMLGARTSAQTPTEAMNQFAQRQFGVPYADLTGDQQAALDEAHPDIVEAKRNYGTKIEREHRLRVDEIDTEFQLGQKQLVQALEAGKFKSRAEFRDALLDASTRRFIQRESADRDFGTDYGPADSPKRKVLDAYYKTFEAAQIAPGKVDWLLWKDEQAALEDRVIRGEFGDAEKALAFIEERRKAANAEEVQWFFDNEDTIDAAGYWDLRSASFDQFRGMLAANGHSDIQNVTELDRAITAAAGKGDTTTANLLMRFRQRIDAVTGRNREMMRKTNPGLDIALIENGWVSKPVSIQAQRLLGGASG